MPQNNENVERVSREKEWHNQAYENNIREKTDKYYSINITSFYYNDLISTEIKNGNSIFLDYGCGTGHYLIQIANKIKNGIGIDISEVSIINAQQIAKENNIDNISFFVMDAMNTTFEDEVFDLICGESILHHLDLKLSLTEIKRILKSNGKAIFLEPLGTNPIISLYRKFTPEVRTSDERAFKIKDIMMIKKIFPATEIYYHSFLTIFAVLFRNMKIFSTALKILTFLDKIVLNKYSPFKWLAWICVLVMKKK